MNFVKNKLFLLYASIIGLIAFVLLFLFFLRFNSSSKPRQIPSPTAFQQIPTITQVPVGQEVLPPSLKSIPILPSTQGGGLDIQSTTLQESISEIKKLYPLLPYANDYTLSTGVGVSILIPGKDLQSNEWTLKTQVFGINYQTSPDQSDYQLMKNSFREAAQNIFDWIKQQGANPQNIIFSWGDKAYIQNQAELWLKSQ